MVGPTSIFNSQKRETPAGAATAQRPLKEVLAQDFQISLADLPILRTKTQAICDDLVSSFIKADFSRLSSNERSRMEEYQTILRKSAFTVEMSDSLAINACTLTANGAVILNVGLLRALASSSSALNNWDSVAFVIAHELSHTLYDRSTLLSVAEKSARYGSLDMENQCDRDAMLLMDVAGFNVRFADLSVLSVTQPEKARDFGVLSSHPHSEVRNLELAKLRNENYWSNYRERSSRLFSAEDLSAINVPTKLELILQDPAGEALSVAPDRSLRELCASALVRFKAALAEELQGNLIIDRGLLYGTIFGQKPASPKDIPAELVEEYEAYQQKVTPLNPKVSESDIVKQFIALEQRASKECFSHGDPSFSLEPLIREATRLESELTSFHRESRAERSRYSYAAQREFLFFKKLSVDKFTNLLEQLPAMRDLPTIAVQGREILTEIFANSDIYKLLMNISTRYIWTEIGAKESLPKVERLTRVALDKFGCGFLNRFRDWNNEKFSRYASKFAEVLASIGSEELMLQFGVREGWDAPLKVPFGKEVFTKNIARLADSQALPIESLESEQIRALLFGPRRSSPTNSMTDLAHESLQRGKLIEPLDLLMLLDYYTDISWKASDFTKVFESCIERSIPAEVTGSDRAEILSFWADKMLSVGIVPIAFQSPASAEEAAAALRSLTPRHYPYGLIRRISRRLQVDFDLAAYVSEAGLAELECTEPKDSLGSSLGLHDFWSTTGLRLPTWRPAQDPALPHDHGIELSHLEAAARHGNPRALGHLIQNGYFDTLERASQFFKGSSQKVLRRASQDLSESPVTGFLGPQVRQGEFVMYRYLQRSGFSDLRELDLTETTQWVSSYLPHPGQLREIVLSRMWKESFKETDYTKEDALAFLKLFEDNSPRRELFARQVYERFKDEYRTVSSRSSFICQVFPCASMARDALFEECLQQLSFKVSSFMEEIQPYLSSSSRSFQRAKSILDGTIGSAIDAWSLEVKREVAEWLFLHKPKPKAITYVEQGIYCKLDELPALMVDKGVREELISKLFLGANGLASGSDLTELRLFLDNSLNSVFAKAHTSNLTRSEIPSKMETFARECIKATVVCSAPHRRETLLRKMFEIAANSTELAPEEFLARWLPAHSAAMIKGLQIIASRPEVRNHLPKLYEASKECKSHAPSMRIIDAMKAIVRNPSLRAEDPQIEGQVAAASIKAVYKARFGETLRALKVKQVTAGKDLAEGQAEIEEIYRVVQPLLTELFGIDTFPQIGRRIACAIASELDFTAEIRNSALLGLALADKRVAKRLAITVSTPRVDGQLSDDNVIVEQFVRGKTLGVYLENNSGDKAPLARVNQRLYLRLLKDGIVLSDLHQGNQMLQGPASMTLIDTGSLFKLDAAELRVFKNIILGLSSPVVPEFFLRRGIKAAVGDAYEKNKALIEERLGSLSKLAGAERPIALLALFDDIPDFYLSESLYWSILGLSKPFGLEQFHVGNIPEYQSVFTGAL